MKKIFVIAIALLFTVQMVFAASVDMPKPKVMEEDSIILQGVSDAGFGEKLTLTVFVSGKDYSDIVDFGKPTDMIAFANVIESGKNGNFYDEWIPGASGYYDIYLANSNGLIETVKNVYVPANCKQLYDIVRTGSSDDLKTLFLNDKNRKDILRSDDVYTEIKYPEQLAAAVYNIRSAVADTVDTDEYIQAAVSIEVLSENKTLSSMKTAFSKFEELGLELDCKEDIETLGTESILADMAADMEGISEKTFTELNSYITDRLVLSGVYKSPNWMDAIKFLNLKKNLKYPNQSNAQEKAAKAVVGKKYDTIDKLQTAINSVSPSVPQSSGGSSGGGVTSILPAVQVDIGTDVATGTMNDVFPDVDNSHYAFDDINYLHWHDVIMGDDFGYFHPERLVTRAEAVKMLCCAFKVDSERSQSFSDVGSESWYFGYVGGAYKNGLVTGGDNGLFYPDEPVTRQDLAVLIMRFAQFYGTTFEEQDVRFADIDSISDYARQAVGSLSAAGIINGVDSVTFAPYQNADRAQTASMLARCMRSAERSSVQ